jgi:hypothetical protein
MLLLSVKVFARSGNFPIVNLLETIEYRSRRGSGQLLENYRANKRLVVIVVQPKLVWSESVDDLC